MNDRIDKRYWKSLVERDGQSEASVVDSHGGDPRALSRRRFLEAAGFTVSLAAVGGCRRAPMETALPLVDHPERIVPGRVLTYASTCAGCPAACGLLAKVRDGRPLKMEGMPEHPLSRGGLCAIGQAQTLGLYDRHRLTGPVQNGQPSTWDSVDRAIIEARKTIGAQGGAVRIVTPTITSPTLLASIKNFLAPYDDARHVVFDAVSSSAILDAHQWTHGARLLPHYHFDQANVIVALGADFLGTWISPVEFTAAWRSRRIPTANPRDMSYHVQMEGRMSLTGTNADKRYIVSPIDYGAVLNHLAIKLSKLAGQPAPKGNAGAASPLAQSALDDLAKRLIEARGESLVVCDSQEVSVQAVVNYINHVLGNYGHTLDIEVPSLQRQGSDTEVLRLVDELKTGQVQALFVAGTDLIHNLPDQESISQAVERIPLSVSFAEREDAFSSFAKYVCPDHHPLESWMDAEPIDGLVSLSQPTLRPLGNTRSIIESLTRWSGGRQSARDAIQQVWRSDVFPRTAEQPFRTFWEHAVHDGFVEVAPKRANAGNFRTDAVQLADDRAVEDQGFTLQLYSKTGLTDSRHAHNPWLQELPDPVTKVSWDNYVCVSPAVAQQLELVDGDVVTVVASDGPRLDLPAAVQPGQHDEVVAIALAYGVRGTDRFTDIGPSWLEAKRTVAKGGVIGKNAAGLIDVRDGHLNYFRNAVTIHKTGRRHELASTQDHHRLEVPKEVAPHGAAVREPIQETTLSAFIKNPKSGAAHHHHSSEVQLWPEDHTRPEHAWGMVIDLNACTGCSACVIACQSENNIPVVGRDEVRRKRDMHWIRLDRYYSGYAEDVAVSHQPMMCQHCDNAPCETVCPVLATVHGEGGLNQQVYNRCVGTRYCANNCPYKVRRFNWFKYARDDSLQNLALNPDVTVRGRGVMEKCSMCVQRIEDGKMEAKRRGQTLADGGVQTACQQSCPARAIVFGDMKDPESHVHAAMKDPRRYGVLEEFNFRPSVAYLRMVRNREGDDSEGHDHV